MAFMPCSSQELCVKPVYMFLSSSLSVLCPLPQKINGKSDWFIVRVPYTAVLDLTAVGSLTEVASPCRVTWRTKTVPSQIPSAPLRYGIGHLSPTGPRLRWHRNSSSSDMDASYAISVRRASGLPAASFRSHLTVGMPSGYPFPLSGQKRTCTSKWSRQAGRTKSKGLQHRL